MKRTIPVILLCAVLMTGCYEDYYDYDTPETTQTSLAEERISTGDISTEGETIVEEGSDMVSPENAPTADQEQMETEAQETEAVSDIMKNEQPAASETTEETETIAQTTEATSCTTESAAQTETTVETEQPTTKTEPTKMTTEPVKTELTVTTEAPTEPEPVPSQNDYEKALTVYEYIRENGHGTCVNYACQTYEKCQEIGLPCYLVWTDDTMYGHVANTVCVNGIWFIMDTQGGYFLEYNYGFTEVVDTDANHIGNSDMLSNSSYAELFG